MDIYGILRIFGLYLLVASTEMLNGIIRARYLNRRLGLKNAKRLSLIPALLFCLLICFFYVPAMHVQHDSGLILLGVSLAAFMFTFDVLLGRFVIKMPWRKILEDFDLRQGNLLAVGLALMALCPWVAMLLRRSF